MLMVPVSIKGFKGKGCFYRELSHARAFEIREEGAGLEHFAKIARQRADVDARAANNPQSKKRPRKDRISICSMVTVRG